MMGAKRASIWTSREWSARDSRIHLITLETPRGPCHAKNVAIEQATGDYLFPSTRTVSSTQWRWGFFARHLNEDPNVNSSSRTRPRSIRTRRVWATFSRSPPSTYSLCCGCPTLADSSLCDDVSWRIAWRTVRVSPTSTKE